MIALLLYIIILLIVFYMIWWLIDALPFPPSPFKQVAKAILAVIYLVILLAILFRGIGVPRLSIP